MVDRPRPLGASDERSVHSGRVMICDDFDVVARAYRSRAVQRQDQEEHRWRRDHRSATDRISDVVGVS